MLIRELIPLGKAAAMLGGIAVNGVAGGDDER
jgi:hypothetical protein